MKLLLNEKYHIWILLIIASIIYFIGNGLMPVTDPIESNYALTAKEMLENNNYLSPQIFGHFWYDKPILFYLETLVAYKIFGISDFSSRFFPSLLALVNIGLIYWFVKKQTNHKVALVAATILATTIEHWIIGKAVITDMTLGLCFNACLMAFYLGYMQDKGKRYYYLAYLASALAVLTKGPIGFLLPGLIILVYLAIQKDLKEILHLHLITGIIIVLLLGGSWYYYMYAYHGQDFIDVFLGVHNWLRATVSEHPRFNVWYYYLVITLIALFPWTILLPKFLYQNRKVWLHNTRLHSFLAVWATIVILFFSCMATKYDTYTFPALAPMVILIAILCQEKARLIYKLGFAIALIYCLLTMLLAIPLMNNAAATKTGYYISHNIDPNALVISGQGKYRVSTTFYGNHDVYKLLPPKEKAPDITAISWNAKLVMPMISADRLPKDKEIFLLTDKNIESQTVLDLLKQHTWQLIMTTDEGSIYQLKSY